MSDTTVMAALRSEAPLVVVEAPAGCGKTHQGAEYARDVALTNVSHGPLILTHTHAACSVFADRTKGAGPRVEIRTIDSVLGQIATAYHRGIGLPADIAAWVRNREDGYAQVALKVAALLKRHPMIAASLTRRHPVVICDEHQDSSGDQHALVMALLNQGAKVRIFADPMQKVFIEETLPGGCPPCDWTDLTSNAALEQLDYPHRWNSSSSCSELGKWTLRVREALKSGGKIDLRKGYPESVSVIYAENVAKRHSEYALSTSDRKVVDQFEKSQSSLLILTHHNKTARSLRAFFNRRILLWEGHSRLGLEKLINDLSLITGDPTSIASSIVEFMGNVGKGFSPSAFGDAFVQEVREGCTKSRKGKAATTQELARFIVKEPNHRGASRMLHRLAELKQSDRFFSVIAVDCHGEFWDAVRLGDFDDVDTGIAEITHRRTYSRPRPPAKAISTIHKAKGLECDSVILMPCDASTFPDKHDMRCLLYVAISRPMRRLMLVVSRDKPSPLLII